VEGCDFYTEVVLVLSEVFETRGLEGFDIRV